MSDDEREPPPMPDEYWQALGLDPEVRHDDAPSVEPPPAVLDRHDPRILPFFTFAEAAPRLNADDFVEGLLVRRSMCVVYGASNSGKTFFMTDLALHVAAGRPWRGRAVEQGFVLYLALEGGLGIQNRIAAWKLHYGLGDYDLPFVVVPISINLLDPGEDAAAVVYTIRAVAAHYGVEPALVVIDTLSRAMAGGNENAAEDMTRLISTGDLIRQQVAACLAWIHHSGKDEARGARGHSSLRAATDTEIEVTAEGHDRLAVITKQRDLPVEGEFPFRLESIELGINERGKPVTSAVPVEPIDDAPKRAKGAVKIKGQALQAWEILVDKIAASGQTGFPGPPSDVLSIPVAWWQEAFADRAMPGAKEGTIEKAFGRARDTLMAHKRIAGGNNRIWLARKEDEATT